MKKVFTGREFTVDEYRKRTRCLQCGILSTEELPIYQKDFRNSRRSGLCERCKDLDLQRCKLCSVLCREGLFFFYNYDSIEEILQNERKKNKTLLKEYTEASMYERPKDFHEHTLCMDCSIVGLSRMKDSCFKCKRKFENNREHYKSYGNYCQDCKYV